jgi:hypothetical protein
MASKIQTIGSISKSFSKCRDTGYSDIACATAISVDKIINIGSVVGGSALIATGVPTNIVGGSVMAFNSGSFGEVAKETILTFCDKDESKQMEQIQQIQEVDIHDEEQREARLRPEIIQREFKNDIAIVRVFGESNHETQVDIMNDIKESTNLIVKFNKFL